MLVLLWLNPVDPQIWLSFGLSFSCFQLIYLYASIPKSMVSHFICVLQWEFFGLLLVELSLRLWLCGRKLDIDLESYDECLSDSSVVMFKVYPFCSKCSQIRYRH